MTASLIFQIKGRIMVKEFVKKVELAQEKVAQERKLRAEDEDL
jgi:hypothetical protein